MNTEELLKENEQLKAELRKKEKETRDLLTVFSTTLAAIDVTQALKSGDIEGVRSVIVEALERNDIIRTFNIPKPNFKP